jgi:hypothetical protein
MTVAISEEVLEDLQHSKLLIPQSSIHALNSSHKNPKARIIFYLDLLKNTNLENSNPNGKFHLQNTLSY